MDSPASIAQKLNKDPKLLEKFNNNPKEALSTIGIKVTDQQLRDIKSQLDKLGTPLKKNPMKANLK